MTESVRVITTKLPTYLEALLQEDCITKLMFIEETIHSPQQDATLEDTSVFELTGTPLQTDLGNDETLGIDEKSSTPTSWTSEEARQFPLTVNAARNILNNQLAAKNSSNFTYCICDGNDPHCTVGLGFTTAPHNINRIVVYVLPCCYNSDDTLTLEYMKKDHIENVGRNAQITVSSKKKYDLYGVNLRNCYFLQNADCNGNISAEVTSAEGTFQNQRNIKMNYQVIVGHSASPLITFLEELSHIQSYIKLLESENIVNGSTVVNSDNRLQCDEIFSLISNFVLMATSFKKSTSENFDLKNFRPLDVLDKLWNVLKQCITLSDLNECFYFFFHELAEAGKNIRLSNDKSALAEIMNGILNGKIAIPTLTCVQSLELLIDAGLEKLKNDYLVIITHFYSTRKEDVVGKWSELSSSTLRLNNAAQRRTRITINPKTVIVDLTSHKLKLAYLDSMHTVAEFMFLYQQQNMSNLGEFFDSYGKALCEKFLMKTPNAILIYDIRQPRLCEFSMTEISTDMQRYIKRESPTASSFTLLSTVQFSKVQTVFHFSKRPIFPPSIFKNYVRPVEDRDDEDKIVFVTKLVKYTQTC